jgi:hypothetical protein
MPNDSPVSKKSKDFRFAPGGQGFRVETGKGGSECFALSEYGDPRQASLEAF